MAALLTNLDHYWKLDGNSNDSVGSSNGSDTSVTYNAGNGIITQGAGFDGAASRITVSSFSRPIGDCSLSFWVNPISFPAGSTEIWWDWTTVNNILIYLDSADSKLKVQVSGSAAFTSAALSIGTWYHIMVVRSGTNAILYVNGTNTSSVSGLGAIASPSASITMGAATGGASYANIKLDEVGFWSRAVGTTEPAQLYNAGIGLQYPFFNILPEVMGVPLEISSLSFSMSVAEVMGIPVDSVKMRYGWGNMAKSVTTWINKSKS